MITKIQKRKEPLPALHQDLWAGLKDLDLWEVLESIQLTEIEEKILTCIMDFDFHKKSGTSVNVAKIIRHLGITQNAYKNTLVLLAARIEEKIR